MRRCSINIWSSGRQWLYIQRQIFFFELLFRYCRHIRVEGARDLKKDTTWEGVCLYDAKSSEWMGCEYNRRSKHLSWHGHGFELLDYVCCTSARVTNHSVTKVHLFDKAFKWVVGISCGSFKLLMVGSLTRFLWHDSKETFIRICLTHSLAFVNIWCEKRKCFL